MATKKEVAEALARKHYQLEEGITEIFRINADGDSNPNEPIKLLEVNTATVSTGVMPIQFGPNPAADITFPSTIIEVTPDEFDMIKSRKLRLPPGWNLGKKIPRQDGGGDK